MSLTPSVSSSSTAPHSCHGGGGGGLKLPQGWEESFAEDVGTFWSPPHSKVDVLDVPPSSLVFLRDYVSPSLPCIIRNAILDPQTGDPLYLTLDSILKSPHCHPDGTTLTVDVTPDGHGDGVRTVLYNHSNDMDQGGEELIFVQPKQMRMSLATFRDRLRHQEQMSKQRARQQSVDSESSLLDINGLPSFPSFPKTTHENLPIDLDSIVYYSRQNDCLRTPEGILSEDDDDQDMTHTSSGDITNLAALFPETFDWAAEAFGTPLEAVNLWMGNQCSVSSMHKDFYENLFYVASGTKVFCVCPPGDAAFLDPYHVEYPIGHFEYQKSNTASAADDTTGSWGVVVLQTTTEPGVESRIIPDQEPCSSSLSIPVKTTTQWIYPDVSPLLLREDSTGTTRMLDSEEEEEEEECQQRRRSRRRRQKERLLTEYPHLRHVHPLEIHVQAGELLYLPALWFHRVTQTEETIGVNYWYDMRFDHPSWCYFNLLQTLQSPTAS